jgi:CTP:phosphocholine cytidylyltransferase-like protein
MAPKFVEQNLFVHSHFFLQSVFHENQSQQSKYFVTTNQHKRNKCQATINKKRKIIRECQNDLRYLASWSSHPSPLDAPCQLV